MCNCGDGFICPACDESWIDEQIEQKRIAEWTKKKCEIEAAKTDKEREEERELRRIENISLAIECGTPIPGDDQHPRIITVEVDDTGATDEIEKR